MDTTEEHLLALAESITIEHGLDAADVLSLADDVLNGGVAANSYPLPAFENLVGVMSDIDEQVPEWLALSESAAHAFSDDQMEIVCLLIEARFWHGTLKKHVGRIWHWNVVFGAHWQTHRQAVSRERITGFTQLMEKSSRKLLPWVDLISRYYEEDFGPGAQVLRNAYFPAGIDDARVGFLKHHQEIKNAYRQLEKRCQLIKKHVGCRNNSLLAACEDVLGDTTALLPSILKLAKLWGKNTKAQKEWWQLPGNSCGLTYSWMTRVDLSTNTYELCMPEDNSTGPWRSYCNHQTPIRMEKGSAWRNFLCNQQQPDLTTTRRHSAEENIEELNEHNGSLEIILPQSFYPILDKYFSKYTEAQTAQPTVGNSREAKNDSTSNVHSKELSLATGEDYWKARDIKMHRTHTRYKIYDYGLLKGRPRFDTALNLRLDFFNAALKDLQSNGYIKDSRSKQACIVIKGVDGN